MEPLIEELHQLWKVVWAIGAIEGKGFKLRVAVLWCIHDYPALSTLSSESRKAIWPICIATRILAQGD
jgi:hypothetical protein